MQNKCLWIVNALINVKVELPRYIILKKVRTGRNAPAIRWRVRLNQDAGRRFREDPAPCKNDHDRTHMGCRPVHLHKGLENFADFLPYKRQCANNKELYFQ